MTRLKRDKLITRTAVIAVVLALLFFTAVRTSPIALGSSAFHHVKLKQRDLMVDAVICISLVPYVIEWMPVVEAHVSADPVFRPLKELQGRYYNRPPPESVA